MHGLALGTGAAAAEAPAAGSPAPTTTTTTTTTPPPAPTETAPPSAPPVPAAAAPTKVVLSNERTNTTWAHPVEEVRIHARPATGSRAISATRLATEDGFPEVYLLLSASVDANGTETHSSLPCALINPALHRFRSASLDSHY